MDFLNKYIHNCSTNCLRHFSDFAQVQMYLCLQPFTSYLLSPRVTLWEAPITHPQMCFGVPPTSTHHTLRCQRNSPRSWISKCGWWTSFKCMWDNFSHTHNELSQINHVALVDELSKVTREDASCVRGEQYKCICLVPPGYLTQLCWQHIQPLHLQCYVLPCLTFFNWRTCPCVETKSNFGRSPQDYWRTHTCCTQCHCPHPWLFFKTRKMFQFDITKHTQNLCYKQYLGVYVVYLPAPSPNMPIKTTPTQYQNYFHTHNTILNWEYSDRWQYYWLWNCDWKADEQHVLSVYMEPGNRADVLF